MDVKEHINKGISRIKSANEGRTKKYKAGLLKQLDENLRVKKQSIEENNGLITRYKSAKPQQLTQMQEALQKAAA